MTLVENKLKNAYIGRVVEHEFDFTDSTWWTLTSATISDWKLLWTGSNFVGYYDMGSTAGAKKITIDCNVYGTTWAWVWTMWQAYTITSWWTDYNIGNVLNYMTSSGYTTSWIKFMQWGSYSWPLIISTDTKYWNGVVMPVHTEFDIQNATASFSMDNTLIWTTTIDSNLIDLFNNQSSTGLFRLAWSVSWWYYTYLKIEIQF